MTDRNAPVRTGKYEARAPDPGTSGLRRAIARAERRRKFKAAGLVLPLVLFLVLFFALPIAVMMYRAVSNPEVVEHFPRASEAIQAWDGAATPDESVYAALAEDMEEAFRNRSLAEPARRLNYEISGYRSLINGTRRALPSGDPPDSWKQTFLEIDEAWGETEYWRVLQRNASSYTPYYLLAAVDLERDFDGAVVAVADDRAMYRALFARTLWMAFVITGVALLLGYPVAFMMAMGSRATRLVLMLFVLLPFWTSLLVRTSAWVVLLQQEGVLNEALQWLGLTDAPVQLIYNRIGVYIGMVHILLPFMVMPIYAVMRGVPGNFMSAAQSLGATPFTAFRRVYLPQTLPGVGAGCLLVFILAIGFYITPALLGSPSDQMVSYFIAHYTNRTVNWGLASALGVLLLAMILVIYAIFNRLVGLSRPGAT